MTDDTFKVRIIIPHEYQNTDTLINEYGLDAGALASPAVISVFYEDEPAHVISCNTEDSAYYIAGILVEIFNLGRYGRTTPGGDEHATNTE